MAKQARGLAVPRRPGPHVLYSRAVVAPTVLAAVLALTLALCAEHGWLSSKTTETAARTSTGLASVSSLLMAFRYNASLARWNDACRQWTTVQSSLRSLMRILNGSVTELTSQEARELFALLPSFALALARQLAHLKDDPAVALQAIVDVAPASYLARCGVGEKDADAPHNVALDILQEVQLRLATMHARQSAPDSHQHDGEHSDSRSHKRTNNASQEPTLNAPMFAHSTGLLNTVTSSMTELERLRDTPVPYSASVHQVHLLHLTMALVPIALVGPLGFYAVLPTALIAYIYYALHHLSTRLAAPFRPGADGLPMRRFAEGIVQEWRALEASVLSKRIR